MRMSISVNIHCFPSKIGDRTQFGTLPVPSHTNSDSLDLQGPDPRQRDCLWWQGSGNLCDIRNKMVHTCPYMRVFIHLHTQMYILYVYIYIYIVHYACSVYLYIHRSSIITLDDSISRTFWGPPTQFPAFSIGEPPWLQFYVHINV